tara:strand:+ start:97 stop:588 length:492 start_codon:yes stop_codon:yes gene_type:complete
MASITFKGNPVNTCGNLPSEGSAAPDLKLVKTDLSEISLADLAGKKTILNIFPSLDTPVCATSVRRFNEEAGKNTNTVVLNISADLPFALKRFCGAEGIENAEAASTFRGTFQKDYGVEMSDSVLAGLCSRAIVVLDENNKVVYTEQVPEITQEPDYEKALSA